MTVAESAPGAHEAPGLRPFLPTLERAREAELIPSDPPVAEARRLVALLVVANLFRRERWRETKSLPPEEMRWLFTAEPPPLPGSYRTWLVGRDAGGRCQLEHVTDKIVAFRDVFVPSSLKNDPVLFGVETAIEALVPQAPNALLECKDLRNVSTTSAYRGTLAQTQKPMFHGHDFEDTIDQGRSAVQQLYAVRGKLISASVQAFAWPLLHVRFVATDPATQLVILPDASGELHAISGMELREAEAERDD